MANAKNAGLAVGIVWGASMLLTGLLAAYLNYGNAVIDLISSVYIGSGATLVGSIIGGVYGFIDGFVGGFLLVWLYNKLEG